LLILAATDYVAVNTTDDAFAMMILIGCQERDRQSDNKRCCRMWFSCNDKNRDKNDTSAMQMNHS
jgi:hypothetical protein